MDALDKLLDDNNIKPAPKQNGGHLDNMFNSPIEQLDDLFKTFGRIFTPYEKNNNIKPKGWRKAQDNNPNI